AEDLPTEVGDFQSDPARRIIDYLVERCVRTLLDGWEFHKVWHKSDRPFPLRPERSHPKIVETEAMMRPKLNSLHDNPVKRGCVSDPTPWRYSSAMTSAKIESWVWVTTDWSF